MPNLQSKSTEVDADKYDTGRITRYYQTCRTTMRPEEPAQNFYKRSNLFDGECQEFEEEPRAISVLMHKCLRYQENFRARQ